MIEIERRFAINLPGFCAWLALQNPATVSVERIDQYYLTPKGVKPTVRVRKSQRRDATSPSWELTIKGKKRGGKQPELNRTLDPGEGLLMVESAVYPVLQKTRFHLPSILILDYVLHGITVDVFDEFQFQPVMEIEYMDDHTNENLLNSWKQAIDKECERPLFFTWLREEITDRGPSNRDLAAQLSYKKKAKASNWDDEDDEEPPMVRKVPAKAKY